MCICVYECHMCVVLVGSRERTLETLQLELELQEAVSCLTSLMYIKLRCSEGEASASPPPPAFPLSLIFQDRIFCIAVAIHL